LFWLGYGREILAGGGWDDVFRSQGRHFEPKTPRTNRVENVYRSSMHLISCFTVFLFCYRNWLGLHGRRGSSAESRGQGTGQRVTMSEKSLLGYNNRAIRIVGL